MSTKTEIKCQLCGELVKDEDLFRSVNENKILVGHASCIKAYLDKKGLNESTNPIEKTGILFE